MRTRRWSAFVLVGLLAACGGGEGGGSELTAVELLSAAPDAAAEAGTARMVMTATFGMGGMDLTMDGEGAVDFTSGNQTFSMSMMGIDMEMRTVDQVMYMRMPEIARPPSVETDWISVPIENAEGMGGAGNPMASMQGGTAMLDALRGMGNEVEELGEDEIDGETVTAYRVTIDMAKAIEALPEDERTAARAGLDQMAAMGLDEWPMHVWLNDDGLPVRMTMEAEMAASELGDAAMEMQIDFLDYGADVEIGAPDAGDVTALSGLTELQEVFGGVDTGLGADLEPSSD